MNATSVFSYWLAYHDMLLTLTMPSSQPSKASLPFVLIIPEDGNPGYVLISRFQAVIFNTTEQKTPFDLSTPAWYSVVVSAGQIYFAMICGGNRYFGARLLSSDGRSWRSSSRIVRRRLPGLLNLSSILEARVNLDWTQMAHHRCTMQNPIQAATQICR